MAAMREPSKREVRLDGQRGAPSRGRPARNPFSQDTPGARLLRNFHASWRALVLRGVADPAFRKALDKLRAAVAEIWEEGQTARLVRHGSGLLACDEILSPYTSGNLLAHLVAEELEGMSLAGISFIGPWDDAEVARFLQLLETWRRSKTPQETRVEEMDAMGIHGVVLAEPESDQDLAEPSSGWDVVAELGELRRRARQTFFHALRFSRWSMRSMSGESLSQLRRARQVVHEIIDRLVEEEFSLLALTALKAFDVQTFLHSVNVCILSTSLGQRLGLNKRELSELGMAALFHDLGKMTVPKPVLRKPGTFSPSEWEIMRMHPLEGVRTLLRAKVLTDPLIKIMLVGLEHHMRFDLQGYPRMNDKWEIGVLSRIVSIADCYDAMISSRSYQDERLTPHRVMLHMLGRSGKNFDPNLMRLFVCLMGLYPVGSLVELGTGELAVVVATDPEDPVSPVVRLIQDVGGQRLDPADLKLVNLSDHDLGSLGTDRIVKALDPVEVGVELADYLL
ncbi:MAG: HD domain-containing protein [Candidatus Eisenbacteria sp.]|nr:HD domain-containing protein [Candidatus Eisenbacteria bacterium]